MRELPQYPQLPQYPHPTWPDTIPLVARVGPPDIIGMIERGSEKDIDPSVKAARGIGGTASRVMFRDPADARRSKKRVEAGKAGALAAPIPPESLEMINNLNRRVEERGGQTGE